jgi:hypothetical protein
MKAHAQGMLTIPSTDPRSTHGGPEETNDDGADLGTPLDYVVRPDC